MGLQTPPHWFVTQALGHSLAALHSPDALQVLTCVDETHSVSPGVQVAHAPFTQAPGQLRASHCPAALQVSTVKTEAPQRLLPGSQTPTQASFTQANSHGESAPHSPV